MLVDRGGRELPIKADAVALKMELPLQQQVKVKVTPRDGSDGIDIEPRT